MRESSTKSVQSNLGRVGITFLATLFVLLIGGTSNAQLTGTKTVPGDYASFAAAITDLNTQGVGAGGVIINVAAGFTETAPAGGYSITTLTGSAANPIIIKKDGAGVNPTLTASAGQTAGSLNDAIIKIIGADFVTIEGFTLQENAANTVTAAATNTMTEWGVALLYTTATDGAQNNTIKNCTITLNRVYQNTFGIYSNSTHTPTTVGTTATATGAAGGNSGLQILGNAISNVNIGIVVVGPTAAADHNDVLVIGGVGNGNTITDFGTTGTFSTYANVSGTVNGILVRNTKNYDISYNTIESSNGGTTAGTLRGIFIPSFTNAPTGTLSANISNNAISLRSGVAGGTMVSISVETTTLNNASTLNINNNNFYNTTHTVTASGSITFILQAMIAQNININNNTFTNLSVNTTGSVTFISNSVSAVATSIYNINGNSIVTAFNKTGAGGTVTFFTSNAGSALGSQINNNNNNFSNITVTGATTIAGWSNTDGGTPVKNVNNNTFSNITGGTSAITILNLNFGINSASGNTISNVTGAGAITGINRGSSGNSGDLINNTISNLTSSGASVVRGIDYTGAGTGIIAGNKIFDLQANNAGGSVIGVSITGAVSPLNVSNNIIGNLTAPISSATSDAVRGFSITSTSAAVINLYYNTVYLNASSSGTNFSSSAIFHTTSGTAGTSALNLRNNIFINKSTPSGTGVTSAYRRSSTTLTNFVGTSNNNLYFAGTPSATNLLFFDGTNSVQTLAAYKTLVSPREAASITEDAPFLSLTGSNPSFLHINPAVPTQVESGAANISGFTTDFDTDIRQGNGGYAGAGSAPDIGADEGNFIVLDLTAPIIQHSPLDFTCSTGDRLVSATVSDATGVPLTGTLVPRIYYRKNSGAWFSQQGVNTGGTATNSSWDFTIVAADMGGVGVNDTVRYYLIAQDLGGLVSSLPTGGLVAVDVNTVTTPPASSYSYLISPSLTGTYSVGLSGAYPTLSAAVNAYNTACLVGPVIFELTDATYPGETFPITVNANTFSSAVNTLTIKPASGISPLLTGSSTTALIKLNGADYVTIDGNNGTSNSWTLENTNASGAVVWIGNSTLTNSASNNSVINTIQKGGSSTTTIAGVMLSSGITFGSAAEVPNNNITISNNEFSKLQNGVFAIGNATTMSSGWNISGNRIGSTVLADKMGFRGIAVQNAENFVVNDNIIGGITTSSTSTSAGILIGGTINTGVVNGNKISDVKNTNTGGYGANGISVNSTANANLTLSNNFISDIAGYGWTAAAIGDNGYGIIINNGSGINIDYNTVLMNTPQTLVGSLPSALNITANITAAGAINVRNNIFAHTQTATTQRYAIYSAAPNTVFGVINNNNYFTTGPNLGFIGSARANLANIQAGFGQNVNSLNVAPVFVSATDLHLPLSSNLALVDKGVVLIATTVDIDGQPRGTTPDIGADEFGDLPATPVSLTQTLTTPSCTGGTALYALPAAPANVVYYLQNAATDTAVANPFVGDSIIVFTNGTYFVRAKNTVTNLWSSGAVSAVVNNVPVAPLPPSPVADASPACLTTNLTVPAPTDPNVTFYWQGTTMGGTSTALNASSPLVVTTSGTYYVSAFDASSNCWSNTNGVAVVIDTFVPSAPSTGPNASVCAGVSSVELTASTPAPGSVQAVFGTNIISSGEAPVVLNATVPAIPAGATVTSTQLVLTNVNAINGSWRSEIRVAVSGISTLPETQLSTLGSSGLISPDPVINIPNVPAGGGAITLTLTESFNDAGVNDATFGEAKIVVNYTIPPTTVTWWDAASAGTQMGSGSPLQTVGTGLLPNTNTPGTYTFYAQANSVACTSNRVPVTVTVNPLPLVDAGTAFTACPLSPITLTATGANTYVWSNGVTNGLAFPAPNVTTLYTVTGTDANNCSSTDTITVFALPATAVSITPSAGPITTCQNQPVVLTANGPANGPAETITQWNFNNSDLIPNEGTGTFSAIGGVTTTFVSSTGSSDPISGAANALNTTAYPAQGTNPKTAGIQMNVSTAGYSNINLTFDVRHSGTAANTYVVQYNPDITNVLSPWVDAQTLVYNTSANFINNQTVNLSAFPAANNNPNLGVRIVSAFDQTSGTTYVGTTGAYGTGGTVRYDMVTFSGEPAGATYLWTGGATTQSITPTISGTYVVTVTEPNGVCPGYDSVQVTINPVPTTTLNPVICANQTYTLANGDVVNTTNIYTRTVPSVVTGCDSIVVVNLTVNPTFNNTVSATICSNETYTLANGTVVTAAGPYTVTVPSVAGCDSTVTVNLTVLPAQLFNVSASICANENYTLPNGTVVTAANTYTTTFTAANGCDSTIVTVLTVKPVFTSTQNPVICDGDLATMPDGTTQGVQGTYVFPYTAVNGCDSTITVNLTVNPVFTTNVTANICAGDSYTLADGSSVNATDVYTVTVPAITGCDSAVVVDLTVRPNYATNTTASICFGQTYTLVNGVTVNQAGTYTAGTTSIYGCDSVVTVVLTVNPVFNQTVNASICEGEDYELPNGNTVTASGSYTSNLQSVFGCDSVVVTNLTVNPLPVVNLGADQAILNPPVVLNAGVGFTTYDWSTGATTQTITVTENGTYGVTVTNQFGCEGSDEVSIYFTASIANLGNNGGSINIFPNPATDVFTVNVNGYTDGGNLKLDLVNALGQVVRTEMVSNVNESFSKMIDVYDLAPGTYTLMVKGTSAEAALRLIIVK